MAINAQLLLEAIENIEVERGVSRDVILASLQESMEKGYRRHLGGDDADVRANIDLEKGIIELYQVKNVVKEVEDDFLEISVSEANELDPSKKYKVGDEFFIPANIDELRKAVAMAIKSVFRQKIAEAEKTVLFEQFKDKIGTMIVGRVEKVDDRSLTVNIGRTSVFLPRNAMIGDEKFNLGDAIKLFVSSVESNSKGAHIKVSRADEGFLKALFFEEINDVYNGTIEIKAIARRAGERSKVAVYSKDPNVDPAGACIGPNGSKIQRVVAQLGNGSSKEKIDIIAWSDNKALFIMESLKPAKALGISLNEETKEATIVVEDDSYSLAIGRKGVNIHLAGRLTDTKLNVITESDAKEQGLAYVTYEEVLAQSIASRPQVVRDEDSLKPGTLEGYIAPQERIYDEEETSLDLTEALNEQVEKEENEAPVVKETTKVVEEVKEEEPAPVVEEVKAPVKEEPKEVKTTTTIEDLEKSLEEDKNKKSNSSKKYNKKKKEEETQEDSGVIYSKGSQKNMSIYSDEELEELEKEEEYENDEYDDEDIDYDEYDSYYDDDER